MLKHGNTTTRHLPTPGYSNIVYPPLLCSHMHGSKAIVTNKRIEAKHSPKTHCTTTLLAFVHIQVQLLTKIEELWSECQIILNRS